MADESVIYDFKKRKLFPTAFLLLAVVSGGAHAGASRHGISGEAAGWRLRLAAIPPAAAMDAQSPQYGNIAIRDFSEPDPPAWLGESGNDPKGNLCGGYTSGTYRVHPLVVDPQSR